MLATATSILAATSSGKSSGSPIGTFILLAVLVVGGYLLLVRPQRARQRKALEMRTNVVPGVEVITTAGLVATVVSAHDDETVTLEIAPGVHSRFLKGAIARVTTPPVEDPADTPTV